MSGTRLLRVTLTLLMYGYVTVYVTQHMHASPLHHVEKRLRHETTTLGSDMCIVSLMSVVTSHWRQLVGLCATIPNEAIWCGSDQDAMVETGWFCEMIQERLSVFGMDQP